MRRWTILGLSIMFAFILAANFAKPVCLGASRQSPSVSIHRADAHPHRWTHYPGVADQKSQ